MRRSSLVALVLVLALAAGREAGGQAWDPFPRLPSGERLAVAPDLDGAAFDNLRACLGRFDSAVGARYFAAVVEVTSPDGSPSPERSDAVPYVDALHAAWSSTGRLDPANDVVMVLGVRNRAVAVRPGARWASRGFEGGAVSRAIEASSFGAYARAGDYGLALCDLALTLDRRLAEVAAPAVVPRPEARIPAPLPPDRAADVPVPGAGAERVAASGRGWGGCALGLLLAIAGLGLLAFVQHRRRERVRSEAAEELGRWKQKIAVAAERVLAIESEHPLYFSSSAERWTGDSRPLDQAAAEAVNRVFLLYAKAFELRDEAEGMIENAKPWTAEPFQEALRLLRESEVRLETGEAEDRRRIFLPLQQEYRGTSARLLDDLEAAYGAAIDSLRRVTEVAERALELGEAGSKAAAEALEAANRRGELELPVEHLQAALDPLIERRLEADELAASDPVAGAAALEAVIAELGQLAARGRRGNAAAEAVRGPITELGARLRAEVARLRDAGYRLEEPGFDPDLRLDRGVAEAGRVEALLAAGEEDEADRLKLALEAGLRDLSAQLEAIEAARDGVPRQLDRLVAESRQLQARVPATEATLARLRAEHAAEAFRDEADNLEELQELLGRLEGWSAEIREDHREERYLSALADLEQAAPLLAEGAALLDAIGAIEQQLAEAREGTRELAERSRQLLGRLDELAGDGRPGLGTELRRAIADLVERTSESLEEAGGPRPRWPELEATLGGAAEELKLTVAQVEAELEAHAASQRLARELGERLAGLEREVTAETRDRAGIERAVAEVAGRFAAWRGNLEALDFSGTELERQGKELAAALDQARGAFEAEMDSARAAESRFRAAESTLARVDGRDYGHGVVADCRAGRRSLEQAEEALERREWETAATLADEALERIRTEERRSRDRARDLELEARRRLAARREAERRAMMRRASAAGGRRAAGSLGPAIGSVIGSAIGSAVSSSRSSFGSRPRRSPSGGSSFGGRGRRSGGSRSGGSSW